MAENHYFPVAEYAACFPSGWFWIIKIGNGRKKMAEYKKENGNLVVNLYCRWVRKRHKMYFVTQF